eukprot:TRINITY_DN7520_c0_g1_i4.p1 TRINITY_DN7520_c0_g1~~TRINITY_DN7520_c0_g1_i4.p1  ORF type:complete len:290 (-),score=70.10 TRINITY_DN7520_c0_g1_i4:29-898(-)
MLQNLGKMVILTGSQIPLGELRNDGRYNLITTMMIAGNYNIPEVCILFNDRLLRGNRSTKVDIWGLNAFHSFNYPPLATVGVDIEIVAEPLPMPEGPFHCISEMDPNIVAIRIFPGLSSATLKELVRGTSVKGIVLEAYGAGNIPERKKEYVNVLSECVSKGIVIVVCSQAPKGTINMDIYATGQALKHLGVISGYDMTIETALVKLMHLFGRNLSAEEVKIEMEKNLVGEVTLHKTSQKKALKPPPEDSNLLQSYHSTYKYFRPPQPETMHKDVVNVMEYDLIAKLGD